MTSVHIVVYAKAPIAGFAKTRLIPRLGAEGAASLAKKLLLHTLDEALAADVGSVELCVTPEKTHKIWPTLELPQAVTWTNQGAGDLGARLTRTAKRLTENGDSLLLIGSDCPQMKHTYLRSAAQTLQTADACLGPATDGGYALLGLNHFHPSLFQDIPWSTSQVAQLTRNRIELLGWKLTELGVLNDIDEPGDLQWLPEGWQI